MATKVEIVNGAYQIIRISGLTVKAGPEEITTGIQVLDDYMAELKPTLDPGYIQPSVYGDSDANDFSGLIGGTIGPIKKMLSVELLTYFGKDISMTLAGIADAGMRSLEHQLVNVSQAQNPATLPLGSGNEWDYRTDKFYPEPNNDDGAEDHFETDVFKLEIPWATYVGDDTLTAVTYEADSGVTLTDDSIDGTDSVVTVSFTLRGQFTVCITAVKDTGEQTTIRRTYNSLSCERRGLRFS